MVIALFGATGRVGGTFLEYALADGHQVRVLVRDASRVRAHERLDVIAGDVLDAIVVERLVRDADAVVSTLGGASLEQPGEAQSQGMRNIVAAMTRLGVKRLLGVANSGIADVAGGGIGLDQPSFPAMFRKVTEKHREAWDAMRASDLDWTLVCCPELTPGTRSGVYRTREHRMPDGTTEISVEDAADLLLRELKAGHHLRVRLGAGY